MPAAPLLIDPDAHLREQQLHREEVLNGRFLKVVRDTVALPDGSLATREYVLHPGAVMIVPLQEDGSVIMERQYRYPVQQVMIEFPAGKIDPGESIAQCAARELQEETGLAAREWARAGRLHPVIAYSDEFIEIWFARGLTRGLQRLDPGEFLDVISVKTSDLIRWIAQGLVTDAKTMIAAFWLQRAQAGDWKLDWQPLPQSE